MNKNMNKKNLEVAFLGVLRNNSLNEAIKFKDEFLLDEESVKKIAEKYFLEMMNKKEFTTALKVKELFRLDEFFCKKIAVKSILDILKNGPLFILSDIMDKFEMDKEFLKDTNVSSVAEKHFIENIEVYLGRFSNDNSIIDLIEENRFDEVMKKAFLKELEKGNIDILDKIKEKAILENNFLKSFEVIKAAKKGFLKGLRLGVINDRIKKILIDNNKDFLQSKEVQKAAQLGFKELLYRDPILSVVKFKEEINLDNDFVSNFIENDFLSSLKEGFIDDILIGSFNISQDFLQSKEVQKAANKGFIKQLEYGSIENAKIIKKRFNLKEDFN